MNATQLLASLALWAAPSSVLATSADRLIYEAPPGCPSQPEFVAGVATRGADIEQPRATDHRRFVVSIRRRGAGFEGAFQMRDDRDATDNREVVGSSCGEVADALAVVTAIALDTAPHAGTGAGPEPSPAVVAAAPEASTTRGAASPAGPSSGPQEEGLRGRTRIFPPRSETVQVHGGALTFDLVRSVTIYGGVTAGLIPSVVLPRYDLSMSLASFITTPDGDHRISGVIFQPRLSFLGRGTYESFDTKTDVTGVSFGIDLCQSPLYDTKGLVLLFCGGYGGGLMTLKTSAKDGGASASKNVGFGQVSGVAQVEYQLGAGFQVGLRLSGALTIGPITAERGDGSRIFQSSAGSGSAQLGLGYRF